MITRVLAFLLVLASPAMAVPVEVTSGEHDGFTRVVLNFGTQTDWAFGRTVDGYRFRPIGQSGDYDLRPIFDKIGKTRLAAVSANPQTSELDIGFACACHAIPFEFRPGIIVIDLRDGPPPKGSSFEEPLPDAASPAALSGAIDANLTRAAPSAAPYNWLDRFTKPDQAKAEDDGPNLAPMPSSAPNLQPLREQLLRQLSRGASEGVVDLALPKSDAPIAQKAEVDAARIALGELGGVETKTARMPDDPMGAQGNTCIESEALNIATWGNENLASVQLAESMANLIGEFDVPNPQAVTRAAQTRLFLGFGQEARQILQAFPKAAANESILLGLSYLVDGEADPSGVFRGQGACATAAALWALASDMQMTQAPQLNRKAAILAFSALPRHLRNFLGPPLVDRLLEIGDDKTADTLRDITLRSSTEISGEMSVMQAKIDLAKGEPDLAESHLNAAQEGVSLTGARALIAQITARTEQGLPIEKATVTALEALQNEMAATELGPEIAVALLHGKAASGDFATAFEALNEYPDHAAAVWRILAKLAEDSQFLTFAISPPNNPVKGLTDETVTSIAQRLLDLGMAQAAFGWMQLGGLTQGQLLAQIHIARRDGVSALEALETDESPVASDLRAKALTLLGDYAGAAQSLASISGSDAAQSLAKAKDWQALAKAEPSQWSSLAQHLSSTPPAAASAVDTFGPLARSLELVEQSATTRGEIEKLLGALPDLVPANP